MRMAFIILLLSLLALAPNSALATWQETLAANFDKVETFDELDDWGLGKTNTSGNNVVTGLPPGSIISWYSYAPTSGEPATDHSIKNHGTALVWRGTGKSVAIGQDWFDNCIHHLGIQTHSGYNNGYSTIHVFYMFKFPKGYMPYGSDPENLPAYAGGQPNLPFVFNSMKHMYISAGWNSPTQFGPDGFAGACVTDGAAYTYYGFSHDLINVHYQSLHHWLIQEFVLPKSDCSGYQYQNLTTQDPAPTLTGGTTVIGVPASRFAAFEYDFWPAEFNEQWIGIEFKKKANTPGNYDGEVEMWVYNESGSEVFHSKIANLMLIGSCTCPSTGLTYGDDEMNKWNHITIGSNRFMGYGGYTTCSDGTPSGAMPCSDKDVGWKEFKDASVTLHNFYVDDIVIHSDRIGVSYFQLLNNFSGNKRTRYRH